MNTFFACTGILLSIEVHVDMFKSKSPIRSMDGPIVYQSNYVVFH